MPGSQQLDEKKEQSRILFISSDDKDAGESISNSNFVVYLKETIDSQQIRRIIVKSIKVPNKFYNIRSGYGEVNNSFTYTHGGGGTLTSEVPQGQYTLAELITTLKDLMDTKTGDTVTIAEDANTKKLTFSTAATALVIDGGVGTGLNYSLGFSVTTASAISVTADEIYDLSGITEVFIQSRALAHSNGVDGSYGVIPILDSISLSDAPFGSYASKDTSDSEVNEVRYPRATNLSKIDISLVDKLGNNLPIGVSSLSLSVKVFY